MLKANSGAQGCGLTVLVVSDAIRDGVRRHDDRRAETRERNDLGPDRNDRARERGVVPSIENDVLLELANGAVVPADVQTTCRLAGHDRFLIDARYDLVRRRRQLEIRE
jgi:hypothetical protein